MEGFLDLEIILLQLAVAAVQDIHLDVHLPVVVPAVQAVRMAGKGY
jgi:hypothetical protein